MSNLKPRLKKLETAAGTRGRWRDFITGKWIPDADKWRVFFYRAGDAPEPSTEKRILLPDNGRDEVSNEQP